MSTSPERRMYLTWKAARKSYDYRRGCPERPLMQVARRFRIPIRELREIIAVQRDGREP